MSEYTRGPWHVGITKVYGPKGEQVANCRGLDEAGHNARFIVKACNSHEEMVRLLERIAAYFQDTDAPLGIEARAILARIEGDVGCSCGNADKGTPGHDHAISEGE